MWHGFRQWALLDRPYSLLAELKPWGTEWKRAVRFWTVLIVLLFISHLLAHLWVFEYAGLWSADTLANLRPAEKAKHTGIVAITLTEHDELLAGTSPIPARNLLQAVCAVLRVKPKVLGVDLDTAHVQIPVDKLPHTSTRIVWAQGIQILHAVDMSSDGKLRDKVEVLPDYVLGVARPPVLHGLAVAPVSSDWSVRTIPLCYRYHEGRIQQTMSAALLEADGGSETKCSEKEETFEEGAYRIHYSFDRFTLADVLPQKLNELELEQCQRGEGDWKDGVVSRHPLKGRVVMLGGEYDSQDWHQTPYGLKSGVEVQASLTEHLLQNSAGHEIESRMEWGVKLALALVIAWIHSRFRPVAALVLSLLGLGLLVLTGGVLAVYFSAYRATTVPFLLGIVIEQLVTSAERAQKGVPRADLVGTASGGTHITCAEHP